MPLETLHNAIAELKEAPKIDIRGKQYSQVATRVEVFRKHFGDEYGIITEPFGMDNEWVRVKCTITKDGVPVATGLAEENRSQGPVNRTSALENCETSAIGRAMAAFGLHGGEYSSGEEVGDAIAKQEQTGKDFAKTNLKSRSHEIVRELHGCTDMDQLVLYWNGKDVQNALTRMKTHYPEGFESCEGEKDKMKEELTDVAERHAIQEENTVLAAG